MTPLTHKQRIRSEAAKRAWRTRRRWAKPTPTMRKIMDWLAADSRRCFSLHYVGSICYYAAFATINEDGHSGYHSAPPLRIVTRRTFRAMELRGWLAHVRRRETGSCRGEAVFNLDYTLSGKAVKILAKKS